MLKGRVFESDGGSICMTTPCEPSYLGTTTIGLIWKVSRERLILSLYVAILYIGTKAVTIYEKKSRNFAKYRECLQYLHSMSDSFSRLPRIGLPCFKGFFGVFFLLHIVDCTDYL